MNKKDKTLAFMELTLWWEDGQRASNAASLAEQARPSGSGLRLPFPSCSCWFPSPLRILQCLQFPQKLLCYAPPSCPFMLLPLLGKISPSLPFSSLPRLKYHLLSHSCGTFPPCNAPPTPVCWHLQQHAVYHSTLMSRLHTSHYRQTLTY